VYNGGVTTITARTVVTPDGLLSPGRVDMADGVITAVGPGPSDAPERTLAPGLVDLQVNGHDDVDVARADGNDWDRLDDLLLAQGVTAWCPTLVTAPLDSYGAPMERLRDHGRRRGPRPTILGVHLEGPFLGARPGAHPPEWLRPADAEWVLSFGDSVALVTIAPEADGAVDAIATLAGHGITVGLGHSAATYEQAEAAIDAGARLVTHVFNGMVGLHHREPGLLGAALADDRVSISLIADLVHVHPAALRIAARAKGADRTILVTDAVAWRAGTVGAVRLTHRDGAPRLPDGTLAGSALTLDTAVRNLVGAGVPLEAAVAAASTNPARLLGHDERGALAPGLRADVVALDEDLRVDTTWVAGAVAYQREPRR
jgi:N-acetylglucosamine-6-phosphate deacetylase